VTLQCLTASPTTNLTWFRFKQEIDQTSVGFTIDPSTKSLSIMNIQYHQGGNFTCAIKNDTSGETTEESGVASIYVKCKRNSYEVEVHP